MSSLRRRTRKSSSRSNSSGYFHPAAVSLAAHAPQAILRGPASTWTQLFPVLRPTIPFLQSEAGRSCLRNSRFLSRRRLGRIHRLTPRPALTRSGPGSRERIFLPALRCPHPARRKRHRQDASSPAARTPAFLRPPVGSVLLS